MTAYRVGVGSGNPVKRRAVEKVLDAEAVESVPVPSGVSEQPVGHAETIAGAKNRAAAVLEDGEYDLGVGIEGGVARFDGAEDLFLVMWAVADDGDRIGRGAGPSLALPDQIAARIDDGDELGPVMDDALDTDGVARRGGAAGALGPFVSELY